ncbi:MAG: aminodeoxychorismate lyase [Pseudomonadota bacterium]|nr:aminodeoxychorismate lyase [Pseudomonadota bacterium]
MLHTWIDGISADVVPVDDRGLNYADGVFETLLCKRGQILGAQLHEARLAQGLARLTFPNAHSLAEAVFATARRLLSGVGHSGVARLTVTRGSGKRGYTPDLDATPRSILVAQDDRVLYKPGVRCGRAETRWADQPQLAGLKLLARTEQVLAAGEAAAAGWDDAIMLDARDQVISSSRGNIFIITAGKVLTPDLATCGIAGTRRQLLVDRILPSLGSEAEVCSVSWDQMMRADAVVITNAVMGVAEVVAIGDTRLPADGDNGLVSRMRESMTQYLCQGLS